MCSFSRAEVPMIQVAVWNCPSFLISISSAFVFSTSVFVSWLGIRLPFCDVPGTRATVSVSFLSTFVLSCCEEHDLSRGECWKHLPAWEVHVRKSWNEIQRWYIGWIFGKYVLWEKGGRRQSFILLVYFHSSPTFLFVHNEETWVVFWLPFSFRAAHKPCYVRKVGLFCCDCLSTWLSTGFSWVAVDLLPRAW